MVSIYIFEAKIVKTTGKYLIYPPKEYQEKLKKLHGRKVKVIVVEESGFYLALLGISLLGRSGYGLLLTVMAIIYCHYYIVKAEEPYLERIFGEGYLMYRLKTPRYIRILRSKT